MSLSTSLAVRLFPGLLALVLFTGPPTALAQDGIWEQYLQWRQRYQAAREQYLEAREHYRDALQQLRDNAAADWDSTVREPAREFWTKTLHFMSEFVTPIRNAAEEFQARGVIPFDAVGRLNGHLARFAELQAEVDAAQTRGEMTSVGKTIIEEWAPIWREVKYVFGLMVADRVHSLLAAANETSERLWGDVERLQGAGVDTSDLEATLFEYDALIDQAEADWERARAAYYDSHAGFDGDGGVNDLDEADETLRRAHDSLIAANRSIVAAHQMLVDALRAWEAQS